MPRKMVRAPRAKKNSSEEGISTRYSNRSHQEADVADLGEEDAE